MPDERVREQETEDELRARIMSDPDTQARLEQILSDMRKGIRPERGMTREELLELFRDGE